MIKHLIMSTILIMSTSALAQVTTMSFMRNNSVDGSETFKIKEAVQQKLMQQGENLEDYQLVGVTLYAKSAIGKASATLIVGQDMDTKVIDREKSIGKFLLDGPNSYRVLNWSLTDQGDVSERWQIRIDGFVKVGTLDIHLSRKSHRIRIPMGGQLFAGLNTLHLKQELIRLGYKPNQLRLRQVTLVAKSRAGHGKAQLNIGQKEKPTKNIADAPLGYSFQDNMPASYNRIQWQAQGTTQGNWQIDLQGQIRVQAIIVEVD